MNHPLISRGNNVLNINAIIASVIQEDKITFYASDNIFLDVLFTTPFTDEELNYILENYAINLHQDFIDLLKERPHNQIPNSDINHIIEKYKNMVNEK